MQARIPTEQCDWSSLQNMSGKSDELAKMRKNDIFLMITAQTDSTMNLFLFEVCAVQLKSNSIELQTKRTLKQQTSKHVTRPLLGLHKTSNVNQIRRQTLLCDNFSHLLHPFIDNVSLVVLCAFQIDFIIVWIMVIIANYNLLFKPLGLTALCER